MRKHAKLLLALLPLLLALAAGIAFAAYFYPTPARVLARMEQRDSPRAKQLLDSYAEEFKALASAADGVEGGDSYAYALNSGTAWDEEALRAMPPELADVLRQIELRHPDFKNTVELHHGQVGIKLTDNGDGFSLLCYPGDELISRSVLSDEEGTCCLDMGDGWALQLYYAPKG